MVELMNGHYRGVVKSHGLNGLCKAYIPSIYPAEYENSPNDLPWAEPAQSITMAGRGGNGIFSYPKIGSTVWVFFEGGDINHPIMIASTLGSSENFDKDKYIIKTDTLTIEVDEKSNQTTITTSNIIINADSKVIINADVDINGTVIISKKLTVNGILTSLVNSIIGGISFIAHKHIGNLGSPTSPPV